jgi:hypothetical protein
MDLELKTPILHHLIYISGRVNREGLQLVVCTLLYICNNLSEESCYLPQPYEQEERRVFPLGCFHIICHSLLGNLSKNNLQNKSLQNRRNTDLTIGDEHVFGDFFQCKENLSEVFSFKTGEKKKKFSFPHFTSDKSFVGEYSMRINLVIDCFPFSTSTQLMSLGRFGTKMG